MLEHRPGDPVSSTKLELPTDIGLTVVAVEYGDPQQSSRVNFANFDNMSKEELFVKSEIIPCPHTAAEVTISSVLRLSVGNAPSLMSDILLARLYFVSHTNVFRRVFQETLVTDAVGLFLR